MHDRVLRKVKKDKVRRKIHRLIRYQQELIDQFDQLQLEAFQEQQDERDIEGMITNGMTEEVLGELMVRRLDRKVSEIFLKTELFF